MTSSNKQQIKKTLWIAFCLNNIVAVFKIIYGMITGTLTMVGDGIHSVTDGFGSIMGIISVEYASRPSDHDHHYGHKKYETLASLAIAFFIGLSSWEILRKGIVRLIHPSTSTFHVAGVWIIVGTILINFLLSRYEKKKSIELNSSILKSDAYHTASDIWVSVSVLISLITIHYHIQWVDTVLSIFISMYLGYTAYRLVKENVLVLTDAAFIDVHEIKNIALKEPGVISCHRVRTRGTPTNAFVDLHIQIAPETTTMSAHQIAHSIENKIKAEFPGIVEVMIHTEPFPDDDDELETDQ